MFKEVYFDFRTSKIHMWEQINGKDLYWVDEWVPYVFIKDPDGDSNIHSIFGDKVVKKDFSSYKEYSNFKSDCFENRVRPEIQYLAEKYHVIPDDDIKPPKLRVRSIDIETYSPNGVPSPIDTPDEITTITITDNIEMMPVSFSLKKYTGSFEGTFIKCFSEADLLAKFLTWMKQHPCDLLTGYNILGYSSTLKTTGFDIPYIINRTNKILGEDNKFISKLSPIGVVRTWISDNVYNVNIAGLIMIDYMDLYRWYSPTKLPSYKLDAICNHELGVGKLDYSEYKDLCDLYNRNFNKFLEYNIIDTKRVLELESKLGYIKLIQALGLLTKAPMKNYASTTALMEGIMLTHYRRNSLCAPRFIGGEQKEYPAAFVKIPYAGIYNWVCDVDIISSYPTASITLEMSPETYYGRISGIDKTEIMECVKNRCFKPFTLTNHCGGEKHFDEKKTEAFNKALERGLFSVAPCGTVFSTQKKGTLAEVQRSVFEKRQVVKSRMKDVDRKTKDLVGKEKQDALDEVDRLFSFQWALKILINGMYGCLAVPYSRYFNTDIAEAVTSCARCTIIAGEEIVNEVMNNPLLTKPLSDVIYELGGKPIETSLDHVIYSDTDSLFLNIGKFIEDNVGPKWNDLSKEVKINYVLKISKAISDYVNDNIFQRYQIERYNSQVLDFRVVFKQEIIAQTALFINAKKRYGYWLVNKEGVPKDSIEVTGLDIISSVSPKKVRAALKDILTMVLKDHSDNDIQNAILKHKIELHKCSPDEISINMGANGI